MKKMKFEETQHEKKSKKWKINENKKMIKKQNEKMKLQMKTNEKYMKNYLKHLQSVARCESYKICTSSGLLYLCSVLPL